MTTTERPAETLTGSAANYLKSCGMTDAEIAAIRAIFLEPAAE